MNAHNLTAALKGESLRLGFDLVGATPAVPTPDFDRLQTWLARGFAGQMRYFQERLDAYRHPAQLLDGAKSLLMLGANYRTLEPAMPGPGQARVSRYAWGADYHTHLRTRLHQLGDFLRRLVPSAGVRGVVDTAPLLERHFGHLAGLGFVGKNNLLINERFGSWFFLAALLTTEELEYDTPTIVDRCGSCRACIDACPTGALAEPYQLDARKCVSYLTVESREAIPEQLRAGCGNRLFGCDTCQEACPWNKATPATTDPAFLPAQGMNPVDLRELLALDEDAFRHRIRHTSLWRMRREGVLRNAAVVSENSRRAKEPK